MDRIFLGGAAGRPQSLLLKYANRHGLIAGTTGSGKTVTMQIMAEAFSRAGVPVFLADVKGDVSGVAKAGSSAHRLHLKLLKRAEQIGMQSYRYMASPTAFWDLFGEEGHPLRASVTALGPLALSRLLDLNETQEGVLNIVFRVAKEQNLELIDLKDLRAMLAATADQARELRSSYGFVSASSVGAIQRRLLVLENQGAAAFFGEPSFNLRDFLRRDADGRGFVNVLAARRLLSSPRVYAMFLFWLLSELYEKMPELGDVDTPRFVFFFDEAHLLFDSAPAHLMDKIKQIARLIRSKGVGVYFVTHRPTDVPEDVLSQLGNRIQHALRAFTPRDRAALREAAQTYRPNPAFATDEALVMLGVGEALVSTLDEAGAPSMVERTLIRPPSSQIGPITAAERRNIIESSALREIYAQAVDRPSAFEKLTERSRAAADRAARDIARERHDQEQFRRAERIGGRSWSANPSKRSRAPKSAAERFTDNFAGSFGRTLGNRVAKALGGLFGR